MFYPDVWHLIFDESLKLITEKMEMFLRTDCSLPQNHLPLQPCALRVSRQPWAPFNSPLQLNNPLWLLKICMFILIPVWLRTLCPTHSRCCHLSPWPTSPCPWTLYSQKLKTLIWGKKSVGYKHIGLSLEQSWLSTNNSFPLLGRSYSIPVLPTLACGLAVDGFGVEFGSNWSYLPTQPLPFWNMDASWKQQDCSRSKKKPWEARGNAFSANGHGDRAQRRER